MPWVLYSCGRAWKCLGYSECNTEKLNVSNKAWECLGHQECTDISQTCTLYIFQPCTPLGRGMCTKLEHPWELALVLLCRNKLSSSHHPLNSLLFALDGYPTATEDPAEIEETVRTGTVGGGTGSGRECRDWVPLTGDPLFPSGRLYFSMQVLFECFILTKRFIPSQFNLLLSPSYFLHSLSLTHSSTHDINAANELFSLSISSNHSFLSRPSDRKQSTVLQVLLCLPLHGFTFHS